MGMDFINGKIKGTIAEEVVEEMLKKLGFFVLKFGQEHILNSISQLKWFIRSCDGDGKFEPSKKDFSKLDYVSHLPDFVIVGKNGKVELLEVKFSKFGQAGDKVINSLKTYPCVVLVVNTEVNDSLAYSQEGEVEEERNDENKEKLNQTRFHIWELIDLEVGGEEENINIKTNTITLKEWLKRDYGVEDNEIIKEYGAVIERTLKER